MGRAKKFFKKVGNFITDQFTPVKHGDAGDNSITGNNLAFNKIYGKGGDDTLKAFGTRNELYGGDDNDYLRAVGVSNKLDGGNGNDRILGLGAHNDMFGGSGDDHLDGIGAYNDMDGGSGNDVLNGIGAHNKMKGGEGNDKMFGLGAYNHMRGGSGADEIRAVGAASVAYGDEGDDIMVGVGGVNILDGGADNDRITAVGGVNTVKGGTGNDQITAVGGVNVLDGGSGEDQIVAVGGVNVIDAGSEDDLVVAVGGVNTVRGGAGKDVIISAGGINVLHGDAGDDLMIAAGLASHMEGGDGDDIMVGISALNTQFGGAGDDILVGIGMGNVQFGGSGDDMLFSVAKDFTLQHGGEGDDLMAALGSLNVQLGDDGRDIAFALGNMNVQAGGADNDLMVGVASGNIQHGGSGDDVLLAKGNTNLQIGAAGGDTMIAHGSSNIQFAGRLAADLPTEVNLMGAEIALPTDGVMDLAQEYLNMDDAQDTETNFMIGMGSMNLQIGAAGDDVGIGLGSANLQLLGGGDDVAIAGGIGNLQLGQDGNDVMVAAQSSIPQFKMSATYQSGGADDDLMITAINDTTKGVPVGMQFGDGGADTMGMVSLDHRYSDMFGFLDTFKAENARGAATATANYAKGVFIDGSTFQFGGAGEDMLISAVSDFAVRSGGDGDDVFLNLVEGGFAAGGDGDDIMVSGLVPSSLYTGGFGGDTMMDFASYVRIAFNSVILEGTADLLTFAVERLTEGLGEAVGSLNSSSGEGMGMLTDGLELLGYAGGSPADLAQEFLTTFDLPAGNNFLGGEGNDVFGIASTSTNAIGGLGDDTYIVHLDAVEEAEVNDAGNGLGQMAEGARKVLDAIDEQEDSNTNATTEVGGNDVLVLRDDDGVSLADVTLKLVLHEDDDGALVEMENGDFLQDLVVLVDGTRQTIFEAPLFSSDPATVTLTGINDTETRIESIRLHDIRTSLHDGTLPFQQIDVAAAFDAGAFSLDEEISATALTDYLSLVDASGTIGFDQMVRDTFDDAVDAFGGLVEGAKKVANATVDAVNTVADIILPDEPVGYEAEMDAEQQAHIDQYSEGGAGADTQQVEDFGQHGEVRTGDVDSFKTNSDAVTYVETTQTLALSDGSLLVLFAVKALSGKHEIHGQRLDSSGNLAGAEFTLQTDNVDAWQWEAMALENNEFALRTSFYEHGEHKFQALPTGEVIKLQDPDDGTYFRHYNKQAFLRDGGVVRMDNVRHGQDEGAAAIKLARPDGSEITVTGKFAGSTLMRQGDIVALADGGFAVAFKHQHNDNDIYVQVFNADGSERSAILNPAQNATAHNDHAEPKLAALADGSFVLVYNKNEGDDAIHIVRLSATGEQIGDIHIIEDARAHPSVAATEDGRIAVSYAMPDGELRTMMKLYDLDFQGEATDDLFVAGNGNDTGRGGAGSDALLGGLGQDLLLGEAGDDLLDGGAGNDTLDGGTGNDVLDGGIGDDVLTGDAGADVFVFSAGAGTDFGVDTITDFEVGTDMLDLLDGTGVDSLDDLLFVQDGDDTLVKVLNAGGEVATKDVVLVDGARVGQAEADAAVTEANAAADALDANPDDPAAQARVDAAPTIEVIQEEVNVIRLEDVTAEDIREDDIAHAGNTVGEYGKLELDHEGTTVETLQSYENPVVVAFVQTNNGTDFVDVRVSDITADSFHIKLQEAAHMDEYHAEETVSYMVVEAGTHILSNGAVIEAGSITTDAFSQSHRELERESVAFESDALGADSHVFATLNTQDGGSFATARIGNIHNEGFDVALATSENTDVELILNGDFSDGGDHWEKFNPTGGTEVQFNGSSEYVEFNGQREDTYGDFITQEIATQEGGRYTVSLDLLEDVGVGDHDFRIEVVAKDGRVIAQQEATVLRDTVREVTFDFVAESDGSTLRITNTGATTSNGTNGKVDNVSVTANLPDEEEVGFIAFQGGDFGDFATQMLRVDDTPSTTEGSSLLDDADTFDFAQVTTIAGTDTVVVRQDMKDGTLFLQEETSKDDEIDHVFEDVSVLDFQTDEGFFLI